jgi:hypothetical protein
LTLIKAKSLFAAYVSPLRLGRRWECEHGRGSV